MKTNWDYTKLAKAYVTRPAYSGTAIDALLKISDMSEGKIICDVGAGVAHLSLELILCAHYLINIKKVCQIRTERVIVFVYKFFHLDCINLFLREILFPIVHCLPGNICRGRDNFISFKQPKKRRKCRDSLSRGTNPMWCLLWFKIRIIIDRFFKLFLMGLRKELKD